MERKLGYQIKNLLEVYFCRLNSEQPLEKSDMLKMRILHFSALYSWKVQSFGGALARDSLRARVEVNHLLIEKGLKNRTWGHLTTRRNRFMAFSGGLTSLFAFLPRPKRTHIQRRERGEVEEKKIKNHYSPCFTQIWALSSLVVAMYPIDRSHWIKNWPKKLAKFLRILR